MTILNLEIENNGLWNDFPYFQTSLPLKIKLIIKDTHLLLLFTIQNYQICYLQYQLI